MNKSDELLQPTSCLNKALPDEPVFVLRANDPVAAQAIRHWATMARGFHEDGKIEEAIVVAHQFSEWRQDHYSAVAKTSPVPEVPASIVRGSNPHRFG